VGGVAVTREQWEQEDDGLRMLRWLVDLHLWREAVGAVAYYPADQCDRVGDGVRAALRSARLWCATGGEEAKDALRQGVLDAYAEYGRALCDADLTRAYAQVSEAENRLRRARIVGCLEILVESVAVVYDEPYEPDAPDAVWAAIERALMGISKPYFFANVIRLLIPWATVEAALARALR
jgi:hypothetical protein